MYVVPPSVIITIKEKMDCRLVKADVSDGVEDLRGNQATSDGGGVIQMSVA